MTKGPLEKWLSKKMRLPRHLYDSQCNLTPPNDEWRTWITFEVGAPLHEAGTIPWSDFKKTRKETEDYLSKASILIDGLEAAWLDTYESELIVQELGPPPPPCLNIYIITLKDDHSESVAYVGKTTSDNRFKGGHLAALKLHDPIYKGYEKRIYGYSIWFYVDDQYLPLEWLPSISLAESILDDIESQIIFDLNPPLNTHKRQSNLSALPLLIQVQNDYNLKLLDSHFFFGVR